MKIKPLSRMLILLLVLMLLFSNVVVLRPIGGVDSAEAAGPVNILFGLFRAGKALEARNEVYKEARATSAEINAYYDRQIETARESRNDIIQNPKFVVDKKTGEKVRSVLQARMARSYIRMEATLKAERKAAIAMIEAEKKKAKQEFEKKLSGVLISMGASTSGGQKIIGQIRDKLGEVRKAAVAMQTALEGGKPIEALQAALLKEAGDSPVLQAAARKLGSAIGHGLDHALGGLLTKIEKAIKDMQGGLSEVVAAVGKVEAEVDRHANRDRQPTTLIEDSRLMGKIRPVDRENPVLDIAAIAFAGAAEISGKLQSGETRGTMRERIRSTLITDRLEGIKNVKSGTLSGQFYCTEVGRLSYEAASEKLGNSPESVKDASTAIYIVCYDIQSQEPVYTKVYRSGYEDGWYIVNISGAGYVPHWAGGSYILEGGHNELWLIEEGDTIEQAIERRRQELTHDVCDLSIPGVPGLEWLPSYFTSGPTITKTLGPLSTHEEASKYFSEDKTWHHTGDDGPWIGELQKGCS